MFSSSITYVKYAHRMDAEGTITALGLKTGDVVWQKPTFPEGHAHDNTRR
jgi:glucose dehydrogenase